MACSRGAASPDAHTQRRLFAASAGYCQNPSCANELFVDAAGKSIHIAEMAHVFAATDGGPRTNANLSKEERGAFENLIMLCAINGRNRTNLLIKYQNLIPICLEGGIPDDVDILAAIVKTMNEGDVVDIPDLPIYPMSEIRKLQLAGKNDARTNNR